MKNIDGSAKELPVSLPKDSSSPFHSTQDQLLSPPKEDGDAKSSQTSEVPVEKILNLVCPSSNETIVEIGVGRGTTTLSLARSAQKVIGIDNSKEMLQIAGQNIRNSSQRNIYLKLGEAEKVPLKSKSANQVLASTVLHHTVSPSKAIREMARILKKRGKLVIIEYEQHNCDWLREKGDDIWLGFLPQDINNWLKRAGLSKIETFSLGKWPPDCPDNPKGSKINIRAFIAFKA